MATYSSQDIFAIINAIISNPNTKTRTYNGTFQVQYEEGIWMILDALYNNIENSLK